MGHTQKNLYTVGLRQSAWLPPLLISIIFLSIQLHIHPHNFPAPASGPQS